MKKTIILTSMMAMAGIVGFSQNKKVNLPEIEKQIRLASFDHLTINGNFKLRLIENEDPSVYIKGNADFVKAFKVQQGKNNLLIRSKYIEKQKDNNQVIITVRNLKTLVVLQNATINTIGMLMSNNLKVVLDSECRIKVKKEDVDKIKPGEYFEIEVKPDIVPGSNTFESK